jgi:hypothetical protein
MCRVNPAHVCACDSGKCQKRATVHMPKEPLWRNDVEWRVSPEGQEYQQNIGPYGILVREAKCVPQETECVPLDCAPDRSERRSRDNLRPVIWRCSTCGIDCCRVCALIGHEGHTVTSEVPGTGGLACHCGQTGPQCKAREPPPMPARPPTVALPPPPAGIILPELCTYLTTGANYARQHFWQCRTCGLVDGPSRQGYSLGCCEVCMRNCHRGHDLNYMGCQPSFCDCGPGCGRTPCRCIPYQP